MINDEDVQDVVLVTQLPSDSWYEGFTLRPNNHILASRNDAPELYSFDPEDPDSQPKLLHTFEGCGGALDISPLPGRPDEYVLTTSRISDISTCHWEDFSLWHVRLSADDSQPLEVVKNVFLAEAGLILGITAVSARTVLLCDSARECIWAHDLATGETTQLLADATTKPARDGFMFGVNRAFIQDGHLWYTNASTGVLCRAPFALDADGAHASITGPVEVVADDIQQCDGLALAGDASAAYSVVSEEGYCMKTTIDASNGKGRTSMVMDKLVNPTAVQLLEVNGRRKLLIVCCGEIDVGWINDRVDWKDIAGISGTSVTVTVTTT